MKSGYKILWTDNALQELEATLNYLKEKWTAKELKNLAVALEKIFVLDVYKQIVLFTILIKNAFEKTHFNF